MRTRLPREFRLQQDQQDCGVACLGNILNYYKAELSAERLREWSGCGPQGTTMLGLYQAAGQAGFQAQGVLAEYIADLREVEHPCILPVTVDKTRLHYVVFYPERRGRRPAAGGEVVGTGAEAARGDEAGAWSRRHKRGDNRLLIGDPAKGLCRMEDWELEEIWPTRSVLLLEPGERLSRWQRQRQKKLGWLWQMLRPDVHLLYFAIALGLVCALLNLSTAVFSQRLVDQILPAKRTEELFAGIVLLGLMLILKTFFSRQRQLLLLRQGYGFNTRLTGAFYRGILHLPKSFFDNRKTGDLVSRLNDTVRIQQAASYVLGEMAIQLLALMAMLALLFVYSWQAGLFCLALLPALFGIANYFKGPVVAGQRAVMLAHALNESSYVDSIRGIHTIKAMNREGLFTGVAREIFAYAQGAVWKLGRIRVRLSTVLEVVVAGFGLTMISWGAWSCLRGSLRVGELIAILQLAGMLMPAAVLVALTSVQVQEAMVALDRMYEFTMLEPESGSGDVKGAAGVGGDVSGAMVGVGPEVRGAVVGVRGESVAGGDAGGVSVRGVEHAAGGGDAGGVGAVGAAGFLRLSMRQVGFRFPGRKLLLKDISLEVEKGEIVAVMGESGQGKSSLLQLLQKFYPAEGGPILVNGRGLDTIDTTAWRKVIGVVPQDIAVFCGSVVTNISLDLGPEHAMEVPKFCKALGFDRWFETFPQGYATMLGEGGVALSGGQKQLLALARCLYAKPQLLLLDEPTAAMDAATERFVIGVLRELRKRVGVFVISHKDSLTRIADRVYVLEGGVTAEVGAAVRCGVGVEG